MIKNMITKYMQILIDVHLTKNSFINNVPRDLVISKYVYILMFCAIIIKCFKQLQFTFIFFKLEICDKVVLN